MAVLAQLEPKAVFRYFEEICGIPHGSSDTQAISDYLVAFAKKRNLYVRQDTLGNVIMKKPATRGYEDVPVVMIQGHMDMVCEKTDDKEIDFHTQGLDLVLDENVIHADRTTLGGDDGIAVAFALAILDADDIPHPALEVVITVDEEIGMLGAAGITTEDLHASYMLNLDSEDEGQLLVGCAGGMTAVCHMPVQWENCDLAHPFCMQIDVDGLLGGHSGMEIIKQRANANKVLGRALKAIRTVTDIRILSIDGGKKDNAIPRAAQAVFAVEAEAKDAVKQAVQMLQKTIRHEYEVSDPEVTLKMTECTEVVAQVINRASGDAIIDALFLLPNGVQKMSDAMPGLVQTSLNLGILTMKEDEVQMGFSVRSSVGSEKNLLALQIRTLCERLGGQYTESGAYTAWEYKQDSKLRDLMVTVYEELYGEKPRLDVIHAGVECGLFMDKMKDLDCVSYGPQMYDIHTPNEQLHVDSVQRTWEYTLEILKRLK